MTTNHNSLLSDRREFSKTVLGGAAVLSLAGSGASALRPIPPGIKIGTGAGQPTEQTMLYLKQLGVTWLSLGASPETATAEGFTKMRRQWEAGGFKVYNIGSGVGPSGSLHNMPEVTLNLPGRDQKIEEYLNYLRYLGEAGIPYTTYAHMGNGIWSSGRITMPRGYDARDMDMASPNKRGHCGAKTYAEPLSHGRVFTKEEIWDNYIYFIKKVVPVAEEAGVRIGIHPDDPPQPVLAGVPRCVFGNFEGFKKALKIADSPNVGMCLCVGCWLEGGPLMGKDVVETIQYFGGQKKLFKVHFRNVSAPLPHFTESLMDDGYYDMCKVMRALVDINFDGIVIPDHFPEMGGHGLTYSIAYMNALLKAVQSNKGKT